MHALRGHIDADEDDGRARPGWYRGDEIPSGLAVEEFARLSAENTELKSKLQKVDSETLEELSVKSLDGSPLRNQVAQLKYIRVVEPRGSGGVDYTRIAMAFDRRDSGEVEEYALAKGLTHWVKVVLVNSGRKVARNVVAEFTATACRRVLVHNMVRPPTKGPQLIVRNKEWYYDPSQPCFVAEDNSADGVGIVRQRIKQVAARGGEEKLIAMGFCADLSRRKQMVVTYNIRSEDGALCTGTFTITSNVREVQMSEKQLCGD